MKKQISAPPLQDEKVISSFGIQRRNMLKFFGASAAVVALGTACTKEGITSVYAPGSTPQPGSTAVNLGVGDVQILNFAYALEQLEAAFYVRIVSAANFTSLFPSPEERLYMIDIRDHEVAHREFFRAAIPPAVRIRDLSPNFSAIDFNTRLGILNQAKSFEDLGVKAYNGAGQYLSNTPEGLSYLLTAGKIVSVEARHASVIRDLITDGTFSDDLDSQALEIELKPRPVVDIANMFLAADSQIFKDNLPV